MNNNDNTTRTEIINGVTVVYEEALVTNDPQTNKYLELEAIKFYDDFGNEFYANCNDINEAYKQIEYLAERGVLVTIGPMAPTKDLNSGKIIPSYSQNGVGLYIIKGNVKKLTRKK